MEEQVIQWIIADSRHQLSDADRQVLDAWRSEGPDNERLYQALVQVWSVSGEYAPVDMPDQDKAWEHFSAHTMNRESVSSPGVKTRMSWIRVAALLLAAIGIGLWIFSGSFGSTREEPLVVYSPSENATYDLEDGSRIFLQSGSQIELLSDLLDDPYRQVRLTGSAFFEIHPDATRPFEIKAGDQMIQVLGTSFHVRSNDAELDVVVREGHVAVSRDGQKDRVDLYKQQHYHLDRTSGMTSVDDDPSGNAWSWQSGILEFYATPLEDVLTDIERHFHIQVRLANPSNSSCRFTSRFSDADASTVLHSIAATFDMELRSSGQGIYYLTDGKCR